MMIGHHFRTTFIVFLLALCTACAPIIVAPGPAVQAPLIDDANKQLIMADGIALPFHKWLLENDEQPAAILLALHGFNDYGAFVDEFAVFLNQHKIAVYAYDQRGFGGSANTGFWAGSDAYIGDASTALSLIKARHPGTPIFAFGESMGGAVLMAANNQNSTKSDGLILAAPAVWGRETMPWYQESALWLMAHTLPYMKLNGRGLKLLPSDNIEMLRALSRDPLIIKDTRVDTIWGLTNLMDRALESAPALNDHAFILYGDNDQIIEKGPTEIMFNRLPQNNNQPLIATYKDGYHMLIRDLGAKIVWRDILAFIQNPAIKVLPSTTHY